MKFKRNEKLTQEYRQELIEGLNQVAQLYFNDDYRWFGCSTIAEYETGVNISNGICNALSDLGYRGYYLIEELQDEMHNEFDNYNKIESPEGWQPRAYMCLFMVEYLKDTV